MSRIHIGLMVAVAVLFFAGVAVVATADAPANRFVSDTTNENWGTPLNEQDFDLQGCQEECRRRFGYELYWRGGQRGAVSPGYWLYAKCIQKCNRAHWDAFDREMDELGKE